MEQLRRVRSPPAAMPPPSPLNIAAFPAKRQSLNTEFPTSIGGQSPPVLRINTPFVALTFGASKAAEVCATLLLNATLFNTTPSPTEKMAPPPPLPDPGEPDPLS